MNAESKVPTVVKSRETEGKMGPRACRRKKWEIIIQCLQSFHVGMMKSSGV